MGEAVIGDTSADPRFGRIAALLGKERSLHEVSQTLQSLVNDLRPGVVGAMHVTCADESEVECAQVFEQGFVRYLLPSLKFGRPAAMRLANLGAQYEWGAAALVEQHYPPSGRPGPQVLLVKINAHVGAEEGAYGTLSRSGTGTPCCGALDALLSGSRQPFAEGLKELFGSEGLDREAVLRDPGRVDPAFRALAAAVVSARLQARKALLDIQDRAAASPACWLVVPSVTLNRAERDTEILCGVYFLNAAESGVAPRYQGLGDDPAGYRIRLNVHGLTVEDDHLSQMRPGRDHRAIVRERLGGLMPAATADERLERLRSDVSADRHHDHRHAQSLLRIALPIMAEIAPVPVALLLFAEGAVSIHHAFRIDRLARELEGSEEAREILEEVHARVDHLDPDRAEALVELLVRQYAGGSSLSRRR